MNLLGNQKNKKLILASAAAAIILILIAGFYWWYNSRLEEEISAAFLGKLPAEKQECLLKNVDLKFLQKLNEKPLPIEAYPQEFSALNSCLKIESKATAL